MTNTLNELSLDSFKELTDHLLDEMTGYVPNKYPILPETEHTQEDVISMKNKLNSVFLYLTYSSSPCKEDLIKLFENDKCDYILHIFKQRKLDIALSLLKQHNTAIKPTLDNFDWKVNWVIGSSLSTTLKYPLLNLDLITLQKKNDTSVTENICLEFTKDEVDMLISCLDNISN